MDRKNKKAAQAAASAANSSGRDSHRSSRPQKGSGQGSQNGSSSSRNPLLSGSTAPTRSLSSSRSGISIPLKAALSPSTPAPPVQDTDFVSFGLPDESNKLPQSPAQGKSGNGSYTPEIPTDEPTQAEATDDSSYGPPIRSPVSPHHPREHVHLVEASTSDSPAPSRTPDVAGSSLRNGFSPGTSPAVGILSTSPFSAPGGAQSIFLTHNPQRSVDFKARSGLSSSLGALNWVNADAPGLPTGRARHGGVYSLQDDAVVEDGELEEFIPGSLTDLLTPEERSRRFSRTNLVRPTVPPAEMDGISMRDVLPDGPHHRHSRSVPAPSLLQDIKSIWTDNGDVGESGLNGISGGGLGNGTPSSFQSGSGFGGRTEDALAPSNASAAFLPGLHHYMNTKTTQRSSLAPGITTLHAPSSALSPNHLPAFVKPDNVAMSPPRTSVFAAGTTYDGRSSDLYLGQTQRHPSGRPIPNGQDGFSGDLDRTAFSPSTRALQAHAPGQSLPQGLAAGYSRMHAQPLPPPIASPSSTIALSPGRMTGLSPGTKPIGHGPNEWNTPALPVEQSATSSTGLETMFSRLSYSAATSSVLILLHISSCHQS